MRHLYNLLFFFLLIIYQLPSYALSGFTLASGAGEPNSLRGGRASLVWDWHKNWLENYAITLTGFWDVSAAYWATDGDRLGHYKNIGAFAAAPVFRIIPNRRYEWPVTPFFEISLGAAVLTNDHLGKRNLGYFLAFQDLVGIGLTFGKTRQFALSYHYLHYSNAHIWPPNSGIDVKYLFQMMYLFD